jgi:hypothetical protein
VTMFAPHALIKRATHIKVELVARFRWIDLGSLLAVSRGECQKFCTPRFPC